MSKIHLNVTIEHELYTKMQDFNIHNPERRKTFSGLLSGAVINFLDDFELEPSSKRLDKIREKLSLAVGFIEKSGKSEDWIEFLQENDIQTIKT